MVDLSLLAQLEETLERCGIDINLRDLSDDELVIRSGLCEMEGKRLLIIDKRLSPAKRMEVMVETLKTEPLENIYLPPAVRRLLGGEE